MKSGSNGCVCVRVCVCVWNVVRGFEPSLQMTLRGLERDKAPMEQTTNDFAFVSRSGSITAAHNVFV